MADSRSVGWEHRETSVILPANDVTLALWNNMKYTKLHVDINDSDDRWVPRAEDYYDSTKVDCTEEQIHRYLRIW